MLLHTFTLLVARQLVNDIERFRASAEIIVVPPLCPVGVSSHDFSHAGALIAKAEAATARWIAQGSLADAGTIPGSLMPHVHKEDLDVVHQHGSEASDHSASRNFASSSRVAPSTERSGLVR